MKKLFECPVSAEQAIANIRADESYALEFGRTKTRVHVLRPWPEDGMGAPNLRCSGLWIFPPGVWAWGLCGVRIQCHSTERVGYTRVFADEELCSRCVEMLGDMSVRCFDPNRHPAGIDLERGEEWAGSCLPDEDAIS
jgi:hypothetical protein